MQTLEFDIRLEAKDYLRFILLHRRRAFGWAFRPTVLFFGALFVIYLVYVLCCWVLPLFGMGGRLPPLEPSFFLPLGAPVLVVLAYGLSYLSIRSQIRRNPKLTEPIHYSVGPQGLDLSARTWTAHHDWSNILRVAEPKRYFFLYILEAQALVVPKRCLTSELEASLRELLAERVHAQPESRLSASLRILSICAIVGTVVLLLWTLLKP